MATRILKMHEKVRAGDVVSHIKNGSLRIEIALDDFWGNGEYTASDIREILGKKRFVKIERDENTIDQFEKDVNRIIHKLRQEAK